MGLKSSVADNFLNSILVLTGATGFIGSEVFCRLAKKHPVDKIIVLGRKRPTDPKSLFLLRLKEHGLSEIFSRINFVETDFEDEAKFQATLKSLPVHHGQFKVVHMAALIHPNAGEEKKQDRVNIGVTDDLVNWAHDRSAEHFVFMSSVVAFGGLKDASVRSEKDFPKFPSYCKNFNYFLSKRHSHEKLVRDCKIPLTILCPSIVHGSLEHFKNSRGHLKALRNGRLSWSPAGGGNFVGLDRVAEGIVHAALSPAPLALDCRLLVDRNLSFKEYFQLYVDLARGDKAQKIKSVPRATRSLLLIAKKLSSGLGISLPSVVDGLAQGSLFLFFDSEFPQPPTEGLAVSLKASLKSL